jgi:DnaJ-class molecular chaperone
MANHTRRDCDSAGDGNCSACHGKGRTLREHLSDAVVVFGHESSCSACGGSGHFRHAAAREKSRLVVKADSVSMYR